MEILKIQIETRFSHILDFSARYKAILSPYLKMSTFKIENFGAPEEYCVLAFKDEPITIDLRWDRAILVAPPTIKNLFDKKGPIVFYFDILEKLRALDSFGEVLNLFEAVWILKEGVSTTSYVEKYLKEKNAVTGFTFEDVSIVEDYKDKEDMIQIQHGLFKYDKDIKKYGLFDSNNDLKEKTGQLFQLVFAKKTNEPSIDEFKKINSKLESIYRENFEK